MAQTGRARLNIAVIGTGISGLSAAWLLSQRHNVTVYEKACRLGGHSNTVEIHTAGGSIPIDTGFIVYNTVNYPNLEALFQYLDVTTKSSNMSFAVSLGEGGFEYAGNSLASLFAQKKNLFRPEFWSMLRGIRRFYRRAPEDLPALARSGMTLDDYLLKGGFGSSFVRRHLLPMAGAIWSAPPDALREYPAAAFIRFFDQHGLLKLRDRPVWRTVVGGSKTYVAKLAEQLLGQIHLQCGAVAIHRQQDGVTVEDSRGHSICYQHVLIGTHADQALALLADASADERRLLGVFRYSRNHAVLHSDARLMPKRKPVWSSWNYLGTSDDSGESLSVTYWMNQLQGLDGQQNFFVTLNPYREPAPETVHWSGVYEHPIFDAEALRAQARLATLQGKRSTWFCGSYFGSGFHEDGLRSGLATAEALGAVCRPWKEAATPDKDDRVLPAIEHGQ